jgi:hypothetical protein
MATKEHERTQALGFVFGKKPAVLFHTKLTNEDIKDRDGDWLLP